MELRSIGQVIAERQYVLIADHGRKSVVVRIGLPQFSSEDGFYCPFEISGLGEDKIYYAGGCDFVQALQGTLKMIGINLHSYRQRYGKDFYWLEDGDDLGFPNESWTEGLAHQIILAFGPVYGIKLSIARNAGSMKNFHFGAIRPHPTGKGTVGQYALHIQCPWRIVKAQCPWRIPTSDLMVTGSSDWWEPAERDEDFDEDTWTRDRTSPSLQEKLLVTLFEQYDADTHSWMNISDRLVVELVEADDYGGLDIHLSGGFRLQAFPSGRSGEHWRLFEPGNDNSHFIVGGE